MKLYKTEEELNQLKVLSNILSHLDFLRLTDTAIDIMKTNADNAIANMIYNLRLKKNEGAISGARYEFEADAINDFLTAVIAEPPTDDKESLKLIIDIVNFFIYICAHAQNHKEGLTTLKLLFNCMDIFGQHEKFKLTFYQFVVRQYCGESSLCLFYKQFGQNMGADDYRRCLFTIKDFISKDTVINQTDKSQLLSTLNNAISPPSVQNVNSPENQNSGMKKWLGVAAGVVVGIVILVLLFSAC